MSDLSPRRDEERFRKVKSAQADSVFEKRDEEKFELFWYWVNERHRIYLKKKAGEPKPWSEDEIFQKYFFTNVFRRLDKTTIWIVENFIEPFGEEIRKEEGKLLIFNLAFARHTNRIGTMEKFGLIREWNPDWLNEKLRKVAEEDGRLVGNAYMLFGTRGLCKADQLVWRILAPLWDEGSNCNLERLYECCMNEKSLEKFCKLLGRNYGFSGFLSYEVATDLTYSPLLRDAVDLNTWANVGPGARGGIAHIWPWIRSKEMCLRAMRYLLKVSGECTDEHVPAMELRDVEHSLCEFHKYVKIKSGVRSKRRRYPGV